MSTLGPAWLLVALSVLADLLGIFSFLGLDANRNVQVVAMIILGLIAIAAATTQLISALKLALSLRGAYYPPGALRAKILGSLLALAVAVALVIGAAVLAFESEAKGTPNNPPEAAARHLLYPEPLFDTATCEGAVLACRNAPSLRSPWSA